MFIAFIGLGTPLHALKLLKAKVFKRLLRLPPYLRTTQNTFMNLEMRKHQLMYLSSPPLQIMHIGKCICLFSAKPPILISFTRRSTDIVAHKVALTLHLGSGASKISCFHTTLDIFLIFLDLSYHPQVYA